MIRRSFDGGAPPLPPVLTQSLQKIRVKGGLGVCYGLQVEVSSFDCGFVFCSLNLVELPLLVEDLFEVFFVRGFPELGFGGEEAFVRELGLLDGLVERLRGGFGEVVAGDLEAVKEEAGAAGVDLAFGDAEEDLADGVLDGGTVFRQGEDEGWADGADSSPFGGGLAGGVVVVAEALAAETGRAAAMAGGKDVTALETDFGRGGFDGHMCWPPTGWCSGLDFGRVEERMHRARSGNRSLW